MAAGEGKSFDEIEDFEKMILLMNKFGISAKESKSLEEMKDHFGTTLDQLSKSVSWSVGQVLWVLLIVEMR